jgi:hypothetical protein
MLDSLGPAFLKITSTLVAGTVLATATDLPGILRSVMEAGPVIVTINNMEIAKTVLFTEKQFNGSYPADPEAVLRRSVGGNPHPHLDEWGKKFLVRGLPRTPYVFSSGPDTADRTPDDLKVWIEVVPPGEKQASLSEALQTGLIDVLTPAAQPQQGAGGAAPAHAPSR